MDATLNGFDTTQNASNASELEGSPPKKKKKSKALVMELENNGLENTEGHEQSPKKKKKKSKSNDMKANDWC